MVKDFYFEMYNLYLDGKIKLNAVIGHTRPAQSK